LIIVSIRSDTVLLACLVVVFDEMVVFGKCLAVFGYLDFNLLETVVVEVRLLGVFLIAGGFASIIF
jgi:hypothetical protein